MARFLIRNNYNGRIIGGALRKYDDYADAMNAGRDQQERHNKRFQAAAGKRRGPCPVVEVLELIWVGEPERAAPTKKVKP